jgi:O-antigen ligase
MFRQQRGILVVLPVLLTAGAAATVFIVYAPVYSFVALAAVLGLTTLVVFLRRFERALAASARTVLFPLGIAIVFISLLRIDVRDARAESLGVQAFFELGLQGIAAILILLGLAWTRSGVRFSPALVLWSAVGALGILSAFWAPQPALATLKGSQLILLVAVVGAGASQFADRVQAVRFTAWLLVVLLLGMALLQMLIEGPSSLVAGYEMGRERLTLLAIHPLVLGGLSGTAAVLLIAHRPQGLDWIAVTILVGVTGLADARFPFIILIVSVAFIFALRSVDPSRLQVAGALLGGLLLIALIGGILITENTSRPGVGAWFASVDWENVRSLNGRVPLWQAIFELQRLRHENGLAILLGEGFGSFRYFGLDLFAYAGDAHNAPIQVLFELGVVGVIVWFGAVIACAWSVWRSRNTLREQVIVTVPILYILGVQMMEASLADSRSFLLILLILYAHAGSSASVVDSPARAQLVPRGATALASAARQ